MGLFAVPVILYIKAHSAKEADEVAADIQNTIRQRHGKLCTAFLDEELPTEEFKQNEDEDLPGSLTQTHANFFHAVARQQASAANDEMYREVFGDDLPESVVTRVIGR